MQLIKNSILLIILGNFINLFCEDTGKKDLNSNISKKENVQVAPKKENYFNKKKKREKKIGEYLRKEFKELTFDELEFNKNIDLKNKDKEGAARYLERMISIWKPNPERKDQDDKICELRLELANVYFEMGLLDKASRAYKEYLKFYPGNANSEFASYRLICCLFNQSSIPERDQSETKEAIKLANDFLERETYTQYKDKVRYILGECNKKLLDSEINVFNYYLVVKKNAEAAQKRLDYIKENFLKNPQTQAGKDLLFDLEEQLKAFKEDRKYVPNYQKNKEPFYAWIFPKRDKNKRSYGERF